MPITFLITFPITPIQSCSVIWHKYGRNKYIMDNKIHAVDQFPIINLDMTKRCLQISDKMSATKKNPQPKAEKNPQPKAEKNPQPKTEKNLQPKAEKNPQPKVEKNPQPKAEKNPQPKVEKNPQPKTEKNPQPKAEKNPQPKAEKNPQPKTEKNSQPKAEKNPQPKAEKNPQPKTEKNSQPKAEKNPQPKAEKNPQPKVEKNPQSKAEKKPQPKAEKNPQPKAEKNPQPKVEKNPQSKAEKKPQPKAEKNPQPKVEKNPQSKAEKKPQPKAEKNPQLLHRSAPSSINKDFFQYYIPKVKSQIIDTDPCKDLNDAILVFRKDRAQGMKTIADTVQKYAFQLALHDESYKDRQTYTTYLSSSLAPPYRLECIIENSKGKLNGWSEREMISAKIWRTCDSGEDELCVLPLIILSIDSNGYQSFIRLIAPSSSHKMLTLVLKNGSRFKANLKLSSNCCQQLNIQRFQSFIQNSSSIALIYLQLYASSLTSSEKKNICFPYFPKNIYHISQLISLQGKKLCLNNEQYKAIQLACSDHPSVAIQSAFGSGKTLVAALIAACFASSSQNKTVLIVSETNAAVAQIAKTLNNLDDFQYLNPIRIVADSADTFSRLLFSRSGETNIDLHKLFDRILTYDLSGPERTLILKFKQKYDILEKYVTDASSRLNLVQPPRKQTDQEADIGFKFQQLGMTIQNDFRRVVEIVLRYHKPRIIGITASKLLKALENKATNVHSIEYFALNSEMVIIDEASQLAEITFLQLLSQLPNAKFRLIGDLYQLHPHAKLSSSHPLVKVGARSSLQLFENAVTKGRSAMAHLNSTYRSHPTLVMLPNKLFYKGKLRSGTSSREKDEVLNLLNFPNKNTPMAFIDTPSIHYRNDSTRSLGNKIEQKVCLDLVCSLLNLGIAPSRISIVTFYLEQRKAVKDLFQPNNKTNQVAINTVDSIQGTEYDIVIILTTKTKFHAKEEFLVNSHRVNVSITRAKLAQFIIGSRSSLRSLNIWKDLVDWFQEQNAIINSDGMKKLFDRK